jgi:hypothetical protein
VPVTPVVVLWGAAQHDVPEGARVEEIEFVAGRRFLDWLNDLEGERVEEAAAADILTLLHQYRANAWSNTRTAIS